MGTGPDDFQRRILLPPRGWDSEGPRFRTGPEAGPGAGGGRSLTTARPRAAAPSLAPRARAGRGKRVGYPRGRGAAARPTPGTPATRSPGPPLPPAPGTRRSAPTSAAWGAEAGPRSGLVGGHRHNALGRPLAARVRPRSAIGCGESVSVGAWGWEHVFLGKAPVVDLCTLWSIQSSLLNWPPVPQEDLRKTF